MTTRAQRTWDYVKRNPLQMQRARRAQLIAESVSVCCPFCGATQPNQDGSEMWIPSDFEKKSGKHKCVSCDAKMMIFNDSKVMFQ